MEPLGTFYALLLSDDKLRRAWLREDVRINRAVKRSRIRPLLAQGLRILAAQLEA
jgi:hypothetical protein